MSNIYLSRFNSHWVYRYTTEGRKGGGERQIQVNIMLYRNFKWFQS